MFRYSKVAKVFFGSRNYSTEAVRKLGGVVKVYTWPPKINEKEVSHPAVSFLASVKGTGHLGHSSLEIIPYAKELTSKYKKIYLSVWERSSIFVNDLQESLGADVNSSSRTIKPARNVYALEDDSKYENSMPKEIIEFKLTYEEFIAIIEEAEKLIKLTETDLSTMKSTDEIIQWTVTTNCTYYVALALTKGGIFPEKELNTMLPWTPLSFSARLAEIKESRKDIEKSFDSSLQPGNQF